MGERQQGGTNGYCNRRSESSPGSPSEFNLLSAGANPSSTRVALSTVGILVRPNPVREPPAVFRVEGKGVASIAVDIYDLSGRRVFRSGWQEGNTFEWQLQNDEGEYLANGCYLYIVMVRSTNGEEWRSECMKLFIMR